MKYQLMMKTMVLYYAWKRCRRRCRQRCWSPWAYINFRFLSFSEGEKGPSGEGALFAGIGIDFVLAEPVKFVPLGGLGNINTF